MEMLQMSETSGSNYPNYFKVFLDNCIQQYGDKFLAGDYLFAAIYFIILDSGFCPLDMFEKHPSYCTESFNIRKLRQIQNYEDDYVRLHNGSQDMSLVYKIPARLGGYRCSCEIQCVPSSENHNYLIVNLVKKNKKFIRSVCINIKYFTKQINEDSQHKYLIRRIKELEIAVKDGLCNPLRESIYISENRGCCAHLLRLPEKIQSQLIDIMGSSPSAVLSITSTCSYFYYVGKNHSTVWQVMCETDFKAKSVSNALLELFQYGNERTSIHRQVYFKLKKKQVQKKKLRTHRCF